MNELHNKWREFFEDANWEHIDTDDHGDEYGKLVVDIRNMTDLATVLPSIGLTQVQPADATHVVLEIHREKEWGLQWGYASPPYFAKQVPVTTYEYKKVTQ
jgi:hypothetical protein